jgi:glycosyltransferase involved in cell wall biosynthesis
MTPRRLLIITYFAPPDPAVGSARWSAMAEWLRLRGHQVTILTTSAAGSLASDSPWTLRTSDLVSVGVLRRLLRRPALSSARTGTYIRTPAPKILANLAVPDEYLLSWVLGALPTARRLVGEREVDCIVSSGPPNSAHLIPLLLTRSRPAWIADFRDGWRFEPLRPAWPTALQDRLDAALERRVVSTAEAVIGVTRPIADDFATRLGAQSSYISNGWDPLLDKRIDTVERPTLDPGMVNVVHTGKLSGLRGRDPRPLFAALGKLLIEQPVLATRLRIVLAGRLDAEEDQLLRELDDSIAVVHVGHLDRDATVALQRDADALLLITSQGHVSQATGKLFEYLTAGRPIIALAQNNEAARIVTETGTGVTVAPDDIQGIARALAAAADGTLASAYAPRNLERYIYPAPADAVAELIECAIRQRHPTRRL